MANKVLRNIPENLAYKIKLLSERERRSENQELLVLLEEAVELETRKAAEKKVPISAEAQLRLWRELSGKWKDDRSSEAIIDDIYKSRTPGRKVEL